MSKDSVRIPKELVTRKLDVHRNGHDSEFIETVNLLVDNRQLRSTLKAGSYFQGMLEGFVKLAQLGLTQQEARVLFACIGLMEYGNWVNYPQSAIAEIVGISQPEVSKAMKNLRAKGLLIREKSPNGRNLDRINATIVWMGRTNKKSEYNQIYQRDMKLLGTSEVSRTPWMSVPGEGDDFLDEFKDIASEKKDALTAQ